MSAPGFLNRILLETDQAPLPWDQEEDFRQYLSLLTRWNAKLNLTAIRDEETILRRHFLECIFCARQIPAEVRTLLDFGSGGGFPGIPIAICRPEVQVTLGESQGKKAAFLREAVRALHLRSEVEQRRAEELQIVFDGVALRAVDKMDQMISLAERRVAANGYLFLMCSLRDKTRFQALAPHLVWHDPLLIPATQESCILFGQKLDV